MLTRTIEDFFSSAINQWQSGGVKRIYDSLRIARSSGKACWSNKFVVSKGSKVQWSSGQRVEALGMTTPEETIRAMASLTPAAMSDGFWGGFFGEIFGDLVASGSPPLPDLGK